MSLPLAHALTGASLAAAGWPVTTPAGLRRGLLVGAMLGACPDIDYALGQAQLLGWGWHHGVTHSVLFAVIVGVAASLVFGARGWRGALACVAAVLSHPLLDYMTTYSSGLLLWWPLTDQRFKLGHPAWSYYWFAGDSQGWAAIAKVAIVEVIVFVPGFALALRYLRRRQRAAEPVAAASTW